jgi:NAD(P)-dependent dehydrogenase (short-subunit alcohol dehydrogenase family)
VERGKLELIRLICSSSVTNFLGPFLLTGLLSSFFSPKVRVILTSSAAGFWAGFSRNIKEDDPKENKAEDGFHYLSSLPSGGSFYGQSKAMQIAFSNTLQRRFDQDSHKSKITASYHPGMVATNIFTSISLASGLSAIAPTILNIIALTSKNGAQGALWLAQADNGFQPGGFYERSHLIVCPWYNYVSTYGIDEKMWNRWNADAGLKESDWHY